MPAIRTLLLLSLLICASILGAVDNPDAPDDLSESPRATAHEQAVEHAAGGNASAEIGAWLAFLEGELAQAQQALSAALSAEEQTRLQRAQSQWRAHFDADEDLIRTIRSRERAGSSAPLSAGLERAAALQQRIEFLLRMRGAVDSSMVP
jgi:hypothetical protein